MKIRAARIKATFLYPYLSTALFSVALHEDETIPTMSITQSGKILYNAQFVESLSIGELAAVLTHEVWHLLRLHAERALDDKFLWNLSGDLAINDSLQGLPGGCVFPGTFGLPSDLIEEEYYELLKDRVIELSYIGVGAGECGSGARGGEQLSEGLPAAAQVGPLTKLDKELLARYTAEQIKSQGNIPNNIKRWAGSILSPRVPWNKELQATFRASSARIAGKTDYLYTRRSRRAQATKAILPGLVSYRPRVSVVLDTSGSMTDKALGACLAEISGLIKALSSQVQVLVTDAAVHNVSYISHIGEVKMFGGGGTDMALGIEEAMKFKPDIIVVLTDGYTNWPTEPVRAKVIACIIGTKPVPPWVKAIFVEET